jgi:hypothetical protein
MATPQISDNVKIIFKAPDMRKPRMLKGILIAHENGKYTLSGRPVFGNAQIPEPWVQSIEVI